MQVIAPKKRPCLHRFRGCFPLGRIVAVSDNWHLLVLDERIIAKSLIVVWTSALAILGS